MPKEMVDAFSWFCEIKGTCFVKKGAYGKRTNPSFDF